MIPSLWCGPGHGEDRSGTWEYVVPSTDTFGESILGRTSHISIILTHFPKVLSLYLLRKHPTSHFLACVFCGQPEQSPGLSISWPSGWRGLSTRSCLIQVPPMNEETEALKGRFPGPGQWGRAA